MKRVNKLYPLLISDGNLQRAITEVNATHRWLPRHRPNKTVAWVETDIPARVAELRKIIEELVDGTRRLAEPLKKRRYDRSAGKWRNIHEPLLWPDQYIHHALVQVLEPVMMRGMDRYCCGSIRGRGIHYGLRMIRKWINDDPKGTKYCLQLDIRHFYDTIRPEAVLARMKRLIKDRRVLTLVERVAEHGVLIGIYCSQWFANTILQPVDMMIHGGTWRVSHYLRYMDNFTIFGPNKRKLHRLLAAIKDRIAEIGLEVKKDWQVFRTSFTPAVAERHRQLPEAKRRRHKPRLPSALGYRFGRGFTLLRKRNLLRIKRALAHYRRQRRQGRRVSNKLAAGLLSQLGQLRHCNHVKIYERMTIAGVQRGLKNVIRRYTRKEQQKWNTFLGQAA